MFLEKYARGFFKRKIVVVGVAIVFVIVLFVNSGFFGGKDTRTKVACVGDSLTYGSGVLKTRELDSYPAKLQTKLGTTYLVNNFGLRNATASEEGDLPYLHSAEYADSLKDDADIVIIMLGTNDSKLDNWDAEAYEAGLKSIVNSYLEPKKKPEVYLVRSPYCFAIEGGDIAKYTIQPAVVKDEVGSIAKTVAEDLGVNFIDLYEATEGQNELYTSDGIHFNKKGYELISSYIYDSII